ncbi:DUF1903-domain-containing protein [Daldinia eschscholtzii]|nr:DUF1903-domain-containing protein [Daldinia eschscholtzii]
MVCFVDATRPSLVNRSIGIKRRSRVEPSLPSSRLCYPRYVMLYLPRTLEPLLDSNTGIDCLGKNGYNEAKCSRFIDALYECCDAFYRKHGDGATSASCPKASLLRLKMKQRQDEQSK